jgi:lysophospholipase L1-like esterase
MRPEPAEGRRFDKQAKKGRPDWRNVPRQLRERDRFPAMSGRGRFVSVLVTIVVALVGFVTGGALPAAAAPATIQYVALGDSYAAGQGAPPYLNPCLQTDQSYPEMLDDAGRIQLQENLGCTGAKTSDVADIVEDLTVLNDDTRLVTLTVGAADLHLSDVLAVCTTRTEAECLFAIRNVRDNLLPTLGSNLTALYLQVADAAPRARIVVTGYPHLLEPTAPFPPFSPALIMAINDATDALNSTIEDAVSVANDADVNIHYVDVTAAFAGHGIAVPAPETPFINPLSAGLPNAFHPTAAGYQAYADAISAALPGGWFKQSA